MVETKNQGNILHFRVDTMRLLNEIADNALSMGNMGVLKIPLNVLRVGLGKAAQRAIEINDPELNICMLELGLYEVPPLEIAKVIKTQQKLISKTNT